MSGLACWRVAGARLYCRLLLGGSKGNTARAAGRALISAHLLAASAPAWHPCRLINIENPVEPAHIPHLLHFLR